MKKLFKKYKLYLYICLFIIIFIALIIILLLNRKPSLYKYIMIDDIKRVSTIKTNDYLFLDSYKINGKVSQYKKEIELDQFSGYIYYIRGKNKYNIYQVKIDTSKSDESVPLMSQIKLTIEEFEREIINQFDNNLHYISEELEGKSNYKIKLPIEESIYKDNRVYIRKYSDKKSGFVFNYYIKDKYLICEFINNIK